MTASSFVMMFKSCSALFTLSSRRMATTSVPANLRRRLPIVCLFPLLGEIQGLHFLVLRNSVHRRINVPSATAIAEIESIYRRYQVLLLNCSKLELHVELHAARRLRGHRLPEQRR